MFWPKTIQLARYRKWIWSGLFEKIILKLFLAGDSLKIKENPFKFSTFPWVPELQI